MIRRGRFSFASSSLLALALSTALPGCGGNPANGPSDEAGRTQADASNAWAKAKAEGKDKRVTQKVALPTMRRGGANGPAGGN